MLALYDALVPWYRLLDPVADHEAEADRFAAVFRGAIEPTPRTLLELGSGAGNNGYFLKRAFACTLTDLSEAMLDSSRALNPDCEHVHGDMRSLRLGRSFDAVLVHDAVVYMTTEAELAAAAATAFAHTRPGGAALFVPDCLRETFVEQTDDHAGDADGRAFRCVEWMWDPDPTDTSYTVDYAFLLRDATGVQAVHDRHVEGLFPRATWLDVLTRAGFRVEAVPRPIDTDDAGAYCEEMFLCRRP